MRHRASNGTELLDWQEVWCFRCRHDHEMHTDTGSGCLIMARGLADHGDGIDEWINSGYAVEYLDEAGNTHEHRIADDACSLPAATVCTKWEPCVEECRTHVNGAVIVAIRRTETRTHA